MPVLTAPLALALDTGEDVAAAAALVAVEVAADRVLESDVAKRVEVDKTERGVVMAGVSMDDVDGVSCGIRVNN